MSSWEKRLKDASERTERDVRLREVPDDPAPEGFRAEELHPHDLIALQALCRAAATREGFAVTVFVRSLDGALIGDVEVACRDERVTVRLVNGPDDRTPSLVIQGRQVFVLRLGESLSRSVRSGERIGVVVCEVDFYASLAEFRGSEAAACIAAATTVILGECLRADDQVVRINEGRFGVILSDLQDLENLEAVLDRIRTAFVEARDDRLNGATVSLGVTIGRAGHDADELLHEAEAALVRAQEPGGNTTTLFDESIQEVSEHRRHLGGRLLRAFGDRTIDADFQPIVEIATGKLRGFETLMRFRDLDTGSRATNPREVLELAGQSGMLRRVEATIVTLACARLYEWGRLSEDLCLSVNLSERQLQDTRVVDRAIEMLDELSVMTRCLEFEVPPSITMGSEVLTNLRAVERLVSAGFSVVVDEVGGPMTALRDLALAGLRGVKLDRRLTATTDVWERAMVTTIIELVSSLGLDVTAVGVETPAQLESLHAAGCRFAQGFLFAAPMSGDQAFEVLRSSADHGTFVVPAM